MCRAGPVQRTHAIPPLTGEDRRQSSTKGDCTGFATIIALDLGKFKTVACVMDTATRTHTFETILMSPATVHDLLTRQLTDPPADTLVVSETCETAGWVHDLCTARAASIIVVNANEERFAQGVRRACEPDDLD